LKKNRRTLVKNVRRGESRATEMRAGTGKYKKLLARALQKRHIMWKVLKEATREKGNRKREEQEGRKPPWGFYGKSGKLVAGPHTLQKKRLHVCGVKAFDHARQTGEGDRGK